MERRSPRSKNNNIRRRRKKKKSPFKLFVILLFIGIVISTVIVFYSGLFSIKNIDVKGNYHIGTESIIKKTGALKKNILFISEKNIEKKLLNNDIKSAKVTKKYPNTLKISVVENKEIAYVKESDENYFLINIDGFIEGKTAEQPESIPAIYGVSLQPLHDGISIFQYENIKLIFDKISEYNLDIIEYNFSDINNITLESKNNTIFLGNTNDLSDKIKILRDILDEVSTEDINIEEINIKNIDKPIIKEK